jgi:hypothetical protein
MWVRVSLFLKIRIKLAHGYHWKGGFSVLFFELTKYHLLRGAAGVRIKVNLFTLLRIL